jgi:hypothetical protein
MISRKDNSILRGLIKNNLIFTDFQMVPMSSFLQRSQKFVIIFCYFDNQFACVILLLNIRCGRQPALVCRPASGWI